MMVEYKVVYVNCSFHETALSDALWKHIQSSVDSYAHAKHSLEYSIGYWAAAE